MNLWIGALLLTLLTALICFYPLLKKQRKNHSVQRDELNKAFYFARLKELEQEQQQGVLENLEQVKSELQHSLLEDIPTQNVVAKVENKRFGKLWFVSGFLTLAIIGGLVYSTVGAWQMETMLEKTEAKLPYFFERLENEQQNPMDEMELSQFATALRLDLQKNPQNARNWWLLGQISMNLDKPRIALDSYERANKFDPENVEYKISYARLLLFSDDQADKQKGDKLLREAIRVDHSNLDALGLLAFRYFETEDYKMAAVTWAMMLRLIPEDDPKVAVLERSIRSARDALEAQEQQKKQQITPKQ